MVTPEKKVKAQTKPKVKVEAEPEKIDRTPEKIARFKRVVGKRATFVIDKLANLGRVTENPQNYEFTEEQILKMFDNIEEFTAVIKQKFLDCISLTDVKDKYKIDFEETAETPVLE